MILSIIVFVDTPPTQNQTLLIERLVKLKYAPLVDSIHGSDYAWFSINTKCPHILYSIGDYYSYTFDDLEENMMEKVDIMIALNHDEVLNVENHQDLQLWLRGLDPTCPDLLSDIEYLKKPIVAPLLKSYEEPEIISYPDCYGFKQIFKDGVGFFEITRPHTDQPYTTYVEDYINNEKDLFSNLFISTQWGICGSDFSFLKKLWDWKMIKENFNIEQLVIDRIERCKAGEQEPRVYRRAIEDVIEQYFIRKEKCGMKRKIIDTESSRKTLTK